MDLFSKKHKPTSLNSYGYSNKIPQYWRDWESPFFSRLILATQYIYIYFFFNKKLGFQRPKIVLIICRPRKQIQILHLDMYSIVGQGQDMMYITCAFWFSVCSIVSIKQSHLNRHCLDAGKKSKRRVKKTFAKVHQITNTW